MIKVLCGVPEKDFARYSVQLPEVLEVQHTVYEEKAMIDSLDGAECILTNSKTPLYIGKAIIDAGTNLKMIQTTGIGYDKIDIVYAAEKGILVCNNKGVNSAAVAEHTVGLILACLRRTVWTTNEVLAGRFRECSAIYQSAGCNELSSRRVGLIGIGDIGSQVARRLRAFGCEICYNAIPRLASAEEAELGVKYLSFDELISSCNVISVHVPLLDSTRRLLKKEHFDAMPQGAVFINCSRGEVVDNRALCAALESGHLAAAGIDVFDGETPDSSDPLLNLSPEAGRRLTLSPHVAGFTDQTFRRQLVWALENIARLENGGKPERIVN